MLLSRSQQSRNSSTDHNAQCSWRESHDVGLLATHTLLCRHDLKFNTVEGKQNIRFIPDLFEPPLQKIEKYLFQCISTVNVPIVNECCIDRPCFRPGFS